MARPKKTDRIWPRSLPQKPAAAEKTSEHTETTIMTVPTPPELSEMGASERSASAGHGEGCA